MLALATFLSALSLSYLGTILLLRLRPKKRFVDVPNTRSSHEVPKPRNGGIAIVGTFLVVFALLLWKQPGTTDFLPLLIGGLIVFAAGVVDDWRSLGVGWRFAAQGAAVAIVLATGNIVDHIYLPLVGTIELGVVAVPFTALFILTSINFYNFIDGIDGLAGGSAFIAACFLSLIAYMTGNTALALVCLAMAGSAVGFLQFNFPPSRLFMGDSGSTFLGFSFACIAVIGNGLKTEIPFFIPVLMLSSLYLDAGLTLVKRAVRGEKIFKPHHTHYYQRLLSLGLNHKQVTVLEYGLTILLGLSGVVFMKAGGLFPFFVTLCWVAVFAAAILKIRGLERGDQLFWERRSLLVIAGDLAMIAVAYFGAYFLRTNFRFTDPEGMAVVKAFPFVLIVRSATFYWYGVYRGVWKYTSTHDVLRIVKAVTTGSLIMVALVVLFYRFVAFPRSLFVIEFVLLILAVTGSRFAYRLFHEFGKEAHGTDVKRVAIIGAGDYAERVGREIRNADGKSVSLVCYFDDDKRKRGQLVHGVPIVGPIDELADICSRFDIHALVIGISNLAKRRLKRIVSEARRAGVHVETRDGAYVHRSRTGVIEMDRIGRNLGRGLPVESSRTTRDFFGGKRVLITHGGEDLGPELAGELVDCNADVVVQVDGRREAGAFEDVLGDRCRLYAGSIESEPDADRVLEAVRPQIVFHCSSLEPGNTVNRDDYLRRKLLKTTSAICAVLPKYSVESIVFLNFWGNTMAGDTAAHLSAAAEIVCLNSSELLRASPKVLRLPNVLTRREVASALSPAHGQDSPNDRYSLLANEALALALDAAVSYKGRVILTPRSEPTFAAAEIPAILNSPGSLRKLPPGPGTAALYPNETVKGAIVRGAHEVISPVYPADRELVEIVAAYARSPKTEIHDDLFAALQTAIFERAVR